MSTQKERSHSIRKTLDVIAEVYLEEIGKPLRHPTSPNSTDTATKARRYIANHLRAILRQLGHNNGHTLGNMNAFYSVGALEKALEQLALDATAEKNKLERIGFSAELIAKISARLRSD